MDNPCTIRALFSTVLFVATISNNVKRSKEKDDKEDVHHSDFFHEEIVVKESSVKEPSLLHRKHHMKEKASAANGLIEGVPIAPGFPPLEIELSERGLNSNEHGSSSSMQDAILPNVHINTYPNQNAAQISHPNGNGHIALFVSPGEVERLEVVELEDGRQGGSQDILSRGSTSMISIQDPEMKNYFKLVCGMFTISCGGFIAIFVDLLGKSYSLDHHKVFLKTAYTFCVYGSCIICLCVIAIYLFCPHTFEVARIVKFLTWIVLATVAYALALIVCLTTPLLVGEEVAVLVLPILPIALVGLIRCKYKSN